MMNYYASQQLLKMAPLWCRSFAIPSIACPVRSYPLCKIHFFTRVASSLNHSLRAGLCSSSISKSNYEEGHGGGENVSQNIYFEVDEGFGIRKNEARLSGVQKNLPPVDLLALSERELLTQCKMETFRASGPGGQHRNKTDSAVRLRHLPTGLVTQASEDRSQHNNRVFALKRLRQLIAIEVRQPIELEGYKAPTELMRILPSGSKAGRKREGGQQIGPNHDDFIPGMQRLLDLLWAVKGSISECAAVLGLSTGVLSKLIVSDKTLWKAVNNLRASHNLRPLRD